MVSKSDAPDMGLFNSLVFRLTDGKAAFYVFLKSEFCEENIEFWTECEEYRTLTSHKDLVSRANSVYEEFVTSDAPKEVTTRGILFHLKLSFLNRVKSAVHGLVMTSASPNNSTSA